MRYVKYIIGAFILCLKFSHCIGLNLKTGIQYRAYPYSDCFELRLFVFGVCRICSLLTFLVGCVVFCSLWPSMKYVILSLSVPIECVYLIWLYIQTFDSVHDYPYGFTFANSLLLFNPSRHALSSTSPSSL